MKIARIKLWMLNLPLSSPYWLSGGRLEFRQLESGIICIETDEGMEGWGENCPWGRTYLPAHGPGIASGLETLAPLLIGESPLSLGHINRVMDSALPGHPYVKSALDIACWDILGQIAGLPLWRLFGGHEAVAVALNSSISTGVPEKMVALIKEASAKGYKTHSAKLGGHDVSTDIARIEAIMAHLPKDEKVTFDINRAWTPATALQVLNAVNTNAWIEQPCETLDQSALVANRIKSPVMLDECLHNFQDHLEAWQKKACAGVKVKPNRLGGLSKSLQIRDFGVSVGWQMHIEDVGGTVLADTAALHLASSTPEAHRLASWLGHIHLADDPFVGQGVRNKGGFATPPDLPGLGVKPDGRALGKPHGVWE